MGEEFAVEFWGAGNDVVIGCGVGLAGEIGDGGAGFSGDQGAGGHIPRLEVLFPEYVPDSVGDETEIECCGTRAADAACVFDTKIDQFVLEIEAFSSNREAGREQSFVELRAWAHSDATAVEERTLSARGRETHSQFWGIDQTDLYLSVDFQRDADREKWKPVHVIGRAVERIDDPERIARLLFFTR